MRRHHVVSLSLLLLLAAAGCSGEDRLSEEEFVEQANAICAEGNEELESAADELVEGGDPSEEDLEGLIDTAIDNVSAQLNGIEDLSPPEDMEADVEDLLETARAELQDLEDAGAEAFTSGEPPFEESNQKARDLGLDECGDES
ncbi:MAG TPA: hypothetical protein VG318_05595 [Actinomycetota bacterium]|nr:hypothetical protein [Actinomycetota bacterium]